MTDAERLNESNTVTPAEPSIRQQAVHTVLAYLLAESKRGHPVERRRRDRSTIIRLRDCLSYRCEALRWHSSLLQVLRRSAERRLNEAHPDGEKEYHLLMLAGSEQHWIFDDLVFNALAAFDYLGNLIGFAYYGDNRRRAKWEKIQRYATDPARERAQNGAKRISEGLTATAITQAQHTLVRGLSEYRHALIHYEAIVGKGTLHTQFGADAPRGVEKTLRFRAPEELYKYLRRDPPPVDEPLQDAALWMVAECERSIHGILRHLERDLRAEAGFDPDTRDGAIEMV